MHFFSRAHLIQLALHKYFNRGVIKGKTSLDIFAWHQRKDSPNENLQIAARRHFFAHVGISNWTWRKIFIFYACYMICKIMLHVTHSMQNFITSHESKSICRSVSMKEEEMKNWRKNVKGIKMATVRNLWNK